MELVSLDKYLDLPREQAYNNFLDERNLKTLKIFTYIFLLLYFITFIATLISEGGFSIISILALLNAAVLLFIRLKYEKLFSLKNIRRSVYFFLIMQLLFVILLNTLNASSKGIAEDPEDQPGIEQTQPNTLKIELNEVDSYTEYIFIFGFIILFFRFSRTELIQLYSIGFIIPIIMEFIIFNRIELSDDIPNILFSLMFFVIAFTSEKKRRQKFLDQHDFYRKKNFENLRMRRELNYAREIQLSMLPGNNAKLGLLEISAVSYPATEVGGDYFDYFKISEERAGLFVCDVSGHGVASGLLLSGLRSCMHLILEDESNPKLVMEKLNRMIRKTQNRRMFVTAIFAMMDFSKNRCTLYNAGHMPPYRISGNSGEIFRIRKHGMALGAMDSVEAGELNGEVHFDFNRGDKIIFYTDGVNESVNEHSAEYGLDNLEIFLNENAGKEPGELIDSLVKDIKKFTGDFPQKDDLTILIAERK